MKYSAFFALLLFVAGACSEPAFNPKPRAYPKIVYPEQKYVRFTENACDFSFEYPDYMSVEQDSSFFEKAPPNPCWFNLHFPHFNGTLHCSYAPINRQQTLEQLNVDMFEMADWHNKKASYIDTKVIKLPNGTTGFVFNIEGPVASPFQFYLTDSTQHFMRGALYFDVAMNPDSIAPVFDFVRKDILHIIETFQWSK